MYRLFELTGKTHTIFLDVDARLCVINRLSDRAEIFRVENIADLRYVPIPDAILEQSGLVQDYPGQFTLGDHL